MINRKILKTAVCTAVTTLGVMSSLPLLSLESSEFNRFKEYTADSNKNYICKYYVTAHQSNEMVIGDSSIETYEKPKISIECLVNIENADIRYEGNKIKITGINRKYLEALVMSEAGGEGYIGCCLVAQTIRDTMCKEGIYDVKEIKKLYKYSGSLDSEPNEDVLNAVAYIFDEGGVAVSHRLIYYYAPKLCKGGFHETQEFVLEYGGHRFFDSVQ